MDSLTEDMFSYDMACIVAIQSVLAHSAYSFASIPVNRTDRADPADYQNESGPKSRERCFNEHVLLKYSTRF